MSCASNVFGAFVLLAGLLPMPVLAQEPPEKGPHCGIVRQAGEHRLELVVSVQTLIVYVLDHKNNPSPEPAVVGKATIAAGDVSEQIYLTAYSGDVFSGTGSFPETGPLQVDITLHAGDGETLRASFGEVRLKSGSWPW